MYLYDKFIPIPLFQSKFIDLQNSNDKETSSQNKCVILSSLNKVLK